MKKGLILSIALALGTIGCAEQRHNSASSPSSAAPNSRAENRPEAVDRLNDSAKILDALVGAPDDAIPETILAKAECVMVVPSMIKGGFVFGGEHGRGVVTCRNNGRWTAPAFSTITGGNWGAQIGAESVDLVLLFMNEHAAQSLLKDNIKLGADASIAAGPLGRHAEASTDVKLNSEILAYSRAKGLFAGLDLGGAAVRPDDDTTIGFYGHKVDWKTILSGGVHAPATADTFLSTIRKDFHEANAR